jgi:putative oxidoreductase
MSDATPAAKWRASAPQLLSVARMVAAAIFIQVGATIVFAVPVGIPPNGGTAPLFSQIWIGGALEVAGGVLLFLGLFTRPAAFVLSGQMAVAYFQFHFPSSFWPSVNGGAAAILSCFLWLYVSAAGPGPWSLDAILER